MQLKSKVRKQQAAKRERFKIDNATLFAPSAPLVPVASEAEYQPVAPPVYGAVAGQDEIGHG